MRSESLTDLVAASRARGRFDGLAQAHSIIARRHRELASADPAADPGFAAKSTLLVELSVEIFAAAKSTDDAPEAAA